MELEESSHSERVLNTREDRQIDKCDKCGCYRPWIFIKKDHVEDLVRKCANCEVLPIYKKVTFKTIRFRDDKEIHGTVYEIEPDNYIILGD